MPSEEELRVEIEWLRRENDRVRRPMRAATQRVSRPSTFCQVRRSENGGPLDLIIEALGLEIAAIKKKGESSRTVDLLGGMFVAVSNGTYIYRFPFTGDITLRDSPIRVQFGQLEVDGLIVSVGEGFVVVALEKIWVPGCHASVSSSTIPFWSKSSGNACNPATGQNG